LCSGGGSGVERLPDGRTITGMIADHDLNKGSPAALKNAFEKKRAVVLLAGSRYRGFPIRFEEKCRYFVLGYYAITHVWCYPEGDVVTGTSHKTGLRIPGQGNSCKVALRTLTLSEQLTQPRGQCSDFSGCQILREASHGGITWILNPSSPTVTRIEM